MSVPFQLQSFTSLRSINLNRRVAYAILLILLAVSCGNYVMTVVDGFAADTVWMNDFQGIYAAASLMRTGQNPYDYTLASQIVQCTNCPYQYPPLLAALFVPFSSASAIDLQRVWLLANQIFLVGLLYFSIRILKTRVPVWFMLLACSLMLAYYPLYTNLKLGNISLLLGFLMVLVYWLWQQERRVLAGLCLGLAIALKLYPALLLLYFVWKKQFRLALYALIGTGILFVLPDILMQSRFLGDYVTSFTQVMDRWYFGHESWIDNQSLHGFFTRLYVLFFNVDPVPGYVRWFSLSLTAALAVILLHRTSHRAAPGRVTSIIEYGLWLFIFPLASPNSWSHYYAWCLMIVPALLYCLTQNLHLFFWRRRTIVTGIVALGLVLSSQPYRIPRLLGYDVQVQTLQLGTVGVLLQSILIYGAFCMVLGGVDLLYQTQLVSETFIIDDGEPGIAPLQQPV
jgi:hypothetical protein